MNNMAANANTLQCQECGITPDVRQLFQCLKTNTHVMCILCGIKNGRICKYDNSEMTINSNPVFSTQPLPAAVKPCKFKDNGCTWVFSTLNDLQSHALECKFRPYQCIGTQLKLWSCDWIGTPELLEEHLKTSHANQCEFYKFWQAASVQYVPGQTYHTLKLIQAFNKKFIFYYLNNANSEQVIFAIYLLGRKIDSEKYLIDFEVKREQRKIKFLESSYCDADGDILQQIAQGRCFSIPRKNIESFAANGQIEFRFIIKRKDIVEAEDSLKKEHAKEFSEKPEKKIEKEIPMESGNLLEALRTTWKVKGDHEEESNLLAGQAQRHRRSVQVDETQRNQQPTWRSNKTFDKPKQNAPSASTSMAFNISNIPNMLLRANQENENYQKPTMQRGYNNKPFGRKRF